MFEEKIDTNTDVLETAPFCRISGNMLYTHTSDIEREALEKLALDQHNKIARYHNIKLRMQGKKPVHEIWGDKAIDRICRNKLLTRSVIEN